MSKNPASDDTHREKGLSRGTFYEWTCPLCSESGALLASDEVGEEQAVEALLAHVRSSDDEVHGPVTSYPDGLEGEPLANHVE